MTFPASEATAEPATYASRHRRPFDTQVIDDVNDAIPPEDQISFYQRLVELVTCEVILFPRLSCLPALKGGRLRR